MEIEVGEYIKDKEGNVTKIINILSLFKDVYLYLGEDGYQYSENAIINHSKNIIDLIEEGDYVNGELVSAIYDENEEDEQIQIETNNQGKYIYYINDDIESIVTKEQFKNIEYRLE